MVRPVHAGLLLLALTVLAVGAFECRPNLSDFDPAVHGKFADGWDKRIHIAYWEKWGSFEREACQAMVDAYNASQNEIFVHYIPTSEVNRKAMLAIMGNNPPDVVGLWAADVPPYAKAGGLEVLDERMRQAGLTEEHFVTNYLRLGQIDGKTYGLPTTPATVALFYNKRHFRDKAEELRAAGLDPDRPPSTLEELDRYAAVLNEFNADGTPRLMGFLPNEPEWYTHLWGYYFGGTLFDESSQTIQADSEANVRAMVWAKRYAEAYGRQQVVQFRSGFGNFDSPYNAFIDGKVSMEINGVWFPAFIARHRPGLEYGVAPMPLAEGVPGAVSLIDSDVIAIPRGSRHPEEAWKFICWMQKQGGLEVLCRRQSKHLPWREASKAYYEGHPNPFLKTFVEVGQSPHAFLTPAIPVWQEYNDEMKRAFEHVWNWQVPQAELAGLTGQARARRVDQLVEEEARKTLGDLRQTMQAKYDQYRARSAAQQARAGQ